jgi:hypothetical protein
MRKSIFHENFSRRGITQRDSLSATRIDEKKKNTAPGEGKNRCMAVLHMR